MNGSFGAVACRHACAEYLNNAGREGRHSPMQTWRSRPPCCGLFARSSVSGLGSTMRWIISLHVMHQC